MGVYQVGDILAEKYEIKAILGAGGMGTVYRARQLDLGRDVAIKVPLPEALEIPGFLARFVREAKTVARLVHDNIVQVYEFTHRDDDCFIVMEYVEGMDLKHLITKPPMGLKIRDLAIILRSSCEGLAHAHEFGIVHRDIKPHNIMVEQRGRGKWRVKIMDFGIAHLDESANMTQALEQLTVTGQAIGTPTYMSPEQIRGTGVTPQSDIYSMGCVIFYLFTRTTPFSGTGFTVAAAHLSDPPPSLRTRVPSLPPEIEEIVNRCLAKDPGQRPQDASDLGQEIFEALKPIMDLDMDSMWPGSSTSGGGTDLIKPTVPMEAQRGPALPTVAGKTLTDAEAPTMGSATVTDQPTPTASPQSQPTITDAPVAPSASEATRTGTAMPAGTADATMAYGTDAGETSPPAAQPAAPAKKSNVPLIATLVIVPMLAVGVGIGVLMQGRDPEPSPDPNNGAMVTPEGPSTENGNGEGPVDPPSENNGDGGEIAVPTTPGTGRELVPTTIAPVATTVPPTTERPLPTTAPPPRVDPVDAAIRRIKEDMVAAKTIVQFAQTWREAYRNTRIVDNEQLIDLSKEVAIEAAVSVEMINLAGGRYTVGSPKNRGEVDEYPQHAVTLSPFAMAKYEVTALEFSAFLNSLPTDNARTRYKQRREYNVTFDPSSELFVPVDGRELFPANGVSWQLAVDYTRWLSDLTGATFRLPSEAEWEVAARTNSLYEYPWGNLPPDQSRAKFGVFEGEGTTVDVVSLRAGANSTGFYHMAGNVAEWCLDWYDEAAYSKPSRQDPNPVTTTTQGARSRRILRGGGYLDRPENLRSAYRWRSDPESQESDIGFRLVKELSK